MGEIPPYAVTYAASVAGKESDDLLEIEEELSQNEINDSDFSSNSSNSLNNRKHQKKKKSNVDIVTSMKLWMIGFLEKYGFWAVLAFAAWPNAAFDMCG